MLQEQIRAIESFVQTNGENALQRAPEEDSLEGDNYELTEETRQQLRDHAVERGQNPWPHDYLIQLLWATPMLHMAENKPHVQIDKFSWAMGRPNAELRKRLLESFTRFHSPPGLTADLCAVVGFQRWFFSKTLELRSSGLVDQAFEMPVFGDAFDILNDSIEHAMTAILSTFQVLPHDTATPISKVANLIASNLRSVSMTTKRKGDEVASGRALVCRGTAFENSDIEVAEQFDLSPEAFTRRVVRMLLRPIGCAEIAADGIEMTAEIPAPDTGPPDRREARKVNPA